MRNKQRITLSAITLAVILAGCSSAPKTNHASIQLTTLLDSYQHESQSLDNTHFGIVNDQMAAARQSLDRLYLEKLLEIERDALTDEEKVYYDTFRFDRTIAIRGASFPNTRFGNFDVPVTHFYNYIQWNAEEAGTAIDDSDNEQKYQEQLTLLKEYTSWVRGLRSQYQQATQQGIQLPAILAERLYQNSVDTISYNNFAVLKVGLNDLKTQSGYTSTFVNQYTHEVEKAQRATQELLAYLHNQYVKSARGEGLLTDKNIGWGDLPNGQSWYQWHLDRNSTTGKSATELHHMGEQLVAEAKAEMIRVAKVVVAKRGSIVEAAYRDPATGDVSPRTFELATDSGQINLGEFFQYLNSEQFFYGRDGQPTTTKQYAAICISASSPSVCENALTDYYVFKDNANDVVASYFKPIKTNYTIEPTPAEREMYDGVASYDDNVFTLNTNPDYSLQKWNVSTLLLHEAAPGHHFQNAYAQEYPPTNLPDYMQDIWYTAYGEGWALYTEWLGIEMGIYGELDAQNRPTFINGKGMCTPDTDYDQFQGGIYTDEQECNALQYFGSLNEAQLRNMRLAVDTGIHANGWSIEQARDYMHANSALGEGDIESESFRYAAYVGQAVSYKSGYLVIRELLEKAQQELGDKFEYAEFHDQLLRYGQQPMEVMKSNINNWISTKLQA
ncbi:DUF885 domain-containing protein [Vibrio neptunius]|uniref:DUF885 domain-containing protein n=1 Tax=Vibrio neptunius TaxID=170651 RepID=A0ABS3A4B3_9VIBR|nr:DUF885 domain-containing protein [Vibrio neptunius]MBN3491609.1 DUF885 domain-containing protein [Vibrio neptunius]MBN3514210.1 DUF885 domain-containing protein [Vibrio neptunius]MBN3551180.1 DUF885 domain-containing protein [Vibrio neptunius]MBN3579310.1 DUF885 domain-containing protein [Vibrio neptunius]MCH9872974.1 DUF885 domain-containing protein [Vibrio neptunius]